MSQKKMRFDTLFFYFIIHIGNVIVSIVFKYPLTFRSKIVEYEVVKIEMKLYIHLQNLS